MTKLKFVKTYKEVDNIQTFVFETGGLSWAPGQFQQYDFADQSGEEHDWRHFFTIASAPSENEIHITTRLTGSDYKNKLDSLKAGDEIEAHDIEGDFTWDDDAGVVLVAGGIGVTPYRSILLERTSQGKSLNAHLLYFGRDENFAFRDEFNELLASHPELKIDYIVGEAVSAETILSHAPESREKTVYLSGPEGMVDAVGEQLTQADIDLKQDWFPGYTEEDY
ncbi:MAG: FAD-dependent oxidoreductase [bacterium]|nr:FAD-dependent oxidoreductase [bacterium]MDN5835514.1 FAD-dependent oxidoreductase [bacterium]